MIASEIITAFELQVSDITELSTTEELYTLNRVCRKIYNDRPWEFLKTNAVGVMSGSGSDGFFITAPSDFSYFYENFQWTDNTTATEIGSDSKVIYVGPYFTPYKIVNYGDRRKYSGSAGYCFYDVGAGKIYFTGLPVSTTYSMDYIKAPADILASESPLIPARFQDVIVFGMAVEDTIMQLSPKATSYAPENKAMYESWLLDLQFWNANLQLN